MRELKITVNGRFLSRPMSGVERFASQILAALDILKSERHACMEGLDFEVVAPPGTAKPATLENIAFSTVGSRGGHLWEQFSLPRRAEGSYIVNLCNTAPLFARRNIVCVHDAHVWQIPENYSWAFRTAYQALIPLLIRKSAIWTTVSKYSSDTLVELGAAPKSADAVIYNGSDHVDGWDVGQSEIDEHALPKPYIFALGSRSPNKNIAVIERMHAALAEMGVAVVLAGGGNANVFSAKPAASEENILRLGYVSDHDIAKLMSNALCFTFPSYFEGFGIPPLEAMRLGCPVLASRTSAMPEVLGDAAILLPPDDLDSWLAAIARLKAEPDEAAALSARGRKRASSFTWRASAIRLAELIKARSGNADA